MISLAGLFAWLARGWAVWMVSMGWQSVLMVVVVWLLTLFFRRSSAGFRHLLWLLVFFKLIFPPEMGAPWSARTLAERFVPAGTENSGALMHFGDIEIGTTSRVEMDWDSVGASAGSRRIPLPEAAFWMWFAVSGILTGGIFVQSARYRRRILRMSRPVPPELSERLERIAGEMGVRRRFGMCVSSCLSAPAVFGFWFPRIVLPEELLSRLTGSQLDHLLGHELAHIRRGDVRVGWVVSLLLCIYWFNPMVWFACYHLRREREMACDDAVLYSTRQEGQEYASTLIRVAETFSEAVPAGAGFLGLFELSNNLLPRIHSALDAARPRSFGWSALALAAAVALIFVPLGSWPPAAARSAAAPDVADAPGIVATVPVNGAVDVDPGLAGLEVTFDRDMGSGFSWTGGSPEYPATSGKPYWRDKRTCVLPVSLEEGRFYRVGINSTSYQNFKSAAGTPALPSVLAFTTKGGGAPVAGLGAPKVVSMSPLNGASSVDPQIDTLTVVFDRRMDAGFSWTGGGEAFPVTTGKPQWSDDEKTCVLPVRLKGGWSYQLGLNSPSHKNFQSAEGIALEPVTWTFSTGN